MVGNSPGALPPSKKSEIPVKSNSNPISRNLEKYTLNHLHHEVPLDDESRATSLERKSVLENEDVTPSFPPSGAVTPNGQTPISPKAKATRLAQRGREDSDATVVSNRVMGLGGHEVDMDDGTFPRRGSDDSDSRPKRPWYHPISLFWLAVENWFLIGIGVVIALASQYPQVAANGGYIRAEYSISYGALAIIFLITGLTLSTQILIDQVKSYHLHLFTQIYSFFFFPAVVFAILSIIQAANNSKLDAYALVGIMAMAILPTTVASNITMTRGADGNVEASTVEVVIGQILGIFLCPVTLQMFLSGSEWAYGRPIAEGGKSGVSGLGEIYKQVAKKLGLGLLLPMFVGQVAQNLPFTKKYVKWANKYLYLPKVATFMLLLIIWSSFSTQFQQKAFESISTQSIILICFLNLALYLTLTLLCIYLVRIPNIPRYMTHPKPRTKGWKRVLYRCIVAQRFPKDVATAICFCAPAKGLTVGAPLVNILYGGLPPDKRAIVTIPIVLYQGQQVAIAQVLTYLFKRWNASPDKLFPKEDDERGPTLPTQASEYRQEMTTLH